MLAKLLPLAGTRQNASNENSKELTEYKSKLEAISRSQAVIEFEMDGTIITANDNFLNALGYDLTEIAGQKHAMFVKDDYRQSDEYRQFWATLNNGDFHSGEFLRVRKDGSEIWIQAMYYPLIGPDGRPVRVVKFASDVTQQVLFRQRTDEAGLSVASAIEQMVQSISEISGHVHETADLASTTDNAIEATAESVRKLDVSSRAIENVVELIRNLADQTNLLALNATIESARAGEAGKGFAVVANEVKELAKQTADATQNIDKSVTEIRSLISESVQSTANVGKNIRGVTERMQSVAAAVEEQSVTMRSLNETASQLRGC